MIVDSAIYVDGKRLPAPASLSETYDVCRASGGVAWIGLLRPSAEEFAAVADEFGLHPLAVEDAVKAHQRSKLERYGDTRFLVVRAAHYRDRDESVLFSELHVFAGPDFVVTVRHGDGPDLGLVRERMEREPELLRQGPPAILYAIVDCVVDDYAPVVAGLENDIDEIEDQVFGGNGEAIRRTYELNREVIQFQRAIKPLAGIVGGLMVDPVQNGEVTELHRYLRDVQDHALRVQEQVAEFRELLSNILSVNLAMVGLQQNDEVKALSVASIAQNDEVKKISAWAAILFAPTLVGTIYGMNFDHMPELDWRFGYPMALVLMLGVSVVLYLVFRLRGWLN
ncbi:MAG: magnesium and cobalt transport protein CorA [Chloroflexota bacterium]|nr:magnesium and cobalt transport protein CorA [Chloroflexota bacterium]